MTENHSDFLLKRYPALNPTEKDKKCPCGRKWAGWKASISPDGKWVFSEAEKCKCGKPGISIGCLVSKEDNDEWVKRITGLNKALRGSDD